MRCTANFFCAFLIVCSFFAADTYIVAQDSAIRTANVKARPSNLDFESGSVGQVPDDWVCPTKDYRAELSEQQPQSGKRAASLQSQFDSAMPGTGFGNLMQAIDATPFRGRRVRFKAFVRKESGLPAASANLWLRVDRDANKTGFFDNMSGHPIRASEWKEYEIVGDIDDDAVVINFGLLLIGQGKAWIDSASFEDLGKLVVRAEAPRPFNGRGLENVIAFTRLVGYVRHFHPSDQAAATNWDSFAVEGVLEIEGARDANELAAKLSTIFRPIAPTVRIFVGEKPPPATELSTPVNVSNLQIVSWRNQGFGPNAGEEATYRSVRVRTPATTSSNSPSSQKLFNANLGGGVWAIVPFAVFADPQGTLPHVADRPADPKAILVKYSGTDRATRLADVALTWNVLQHFYPYFDVVKTDWTQVLSTALNAAAIDASSESFGITLRRMIAQLQDGHGNVNYAGRWQDSSIPVTFGWLEGHLVITEVARQGAEGLQPGDVVVKIDGRDPLEVLNERESLTSGATPQWCRFVAVAFLPDGPKGSEVKLEVENDKGQRRLVTLRRSVEAGTIPETRPAKIVELRPGSFYVALDRIKDEDFQQALPQLEKAKGIVFDLRGYPSVSPMIISHLIDAPVTSARWMVPIVTVPDHLKMEEFETGGGWNLRPIAPRLKAKLAFLTDGRAISYAESYLGIIEAYKLADIVGEPTAGTNGNVNSFTLPGGYTVFFTGMKVLKHDGSQHHGVGIKPTVPISRTIRGVRERRDEQLERAVEIVSQ